MPATLTTVFDAIDKMSATMAQIAESGRNMTSVWDEAEESADEAFSTATDQIAQTVTVAEEAAEATEEFGDAMQESAREAGVFGKESTAAVSSLDQLLATVGIVKALQAIYQGFKDSVDAAIEFESAITGVYKTVDGTEEQLARISDDIKGLALVMPATTTEIAGVAEAAGQLGIATDNITSFTEVMINLGEATNLTSDSAASALAKFANVTQMSAAEYENLGSTIVALGNNFATTEADIVAMATNMASAASIAGFTEPQIMALSTALSSVGIEAQAGGSSMARMISSMQVAVETGSDQLQNFAYVAGMTADEFSQTWGNDAVDALYAFIAGLNDTERVGQTATVMLQEMGITEIRLSNAIKALANDSEGMARAIDVANTAWEENTALAAEAALRYGTLESNLAMTENASNNLSIAVGDVFAPAVGNASDMWRDMLVGMTGFVEENPGVVKGVAAVTAGVAAFTIALAAYTVGAKIATAVTAALGGAFSFSNPIVLVATAIAAVTVGLVALATSAQDARDEYYDLTAESQRNYDAVQDLTRAYEDATEQYGEASVEAAHYRYELELAEEAYNSNRQTMEEYMAAHDALMVKHDEMIKSYKESSAEIDVEASRVEYLIGRLEEYGNMSTRTAGDEETMRSIVAALNAEMPELALTYEDVANSMDAVSRSAREMSAAEAEHQQQMLDAQRRTELLAEMSDYEKMIESDRTNLELAQQAAVDAEDALIKARQAADAVWQYQDEETAFESAKEQVEQLTAALAENEAALESDRAELNQLSDAVTEYAEATVDAETAVSRALLTVSSDLGKLTTAYDEAYTAARESIDGTIGLFQKMSTESEISVNDMLRAFESQVQYLETYSENLRKAAEYGLDDGLLASLSDGSEESAGYIDAIVKNIEKLGGTTEGLSDKASSFVEDFNDAYKQTETAKDEFATTVATMETDFNDAMDDIEARMLEAVDNMTMDAEAADAARETIGAYIDTIKGMTSEAGAAASAVASSVKNSLYSGTLGGSTSVPGYATGTTDAPDVFIAGEDGPELIVGAGGSRVFSNEETESILSNARGKGAGDQGGGYEPVGLSGAGGSETRHVIELVGIGSLPIDRGMTEDDVVDILMENIRPVLINMVQEEKLVEGERTYDF